MDSPSDLTGARVLVTGAAGFTGRYMVDQLAKAGAHVFDLNLEGRAQVNLLDRQGLSERVREISPQRVIHLAAVAFVAHGSAEDIYKVNIIGTRNLLEAVADLPVPPENVLLASSANVYGNAGGRLDERSPFSPQNDYAVSKAAMESMAALWRDHVPLTIVRPFNYTGVGQAEKFLIPKIISHFRNRLPVIELGNLDVSRDFSDVRQVALAYRRLIALPGRGHAYNVCSGMEYSLEKIIEMMRGIAGHQIQIRVNPRFVRENEVKSLCGDNKLLVAEIGPLQDIPFEETLRWMYSQP